MPRMARTISGEINAAFISSSNFHFSPVERRPPTVSQFTIHSILLQVLANFLELKYQGKKFSPFEAHPAITLIAIASFFLYCFACYNDPRLTSDQRCAVLFGWLSSVSLASILYPDFSPVLFLLSVLFLVGVLLNLRLQELWNWVQQRMRPNPLRQERIGVLLNLRFQELWNWVQRRMRSNPLREERIRDWNVGRLPV